jgi:hypothetical protein
MKYYHIAFWTPMGAGTLFYRGKEHPLMPDAYKEKVTSLIGQLNIKCGQSFPPEAVVYTSLHELPLEVAKARWPEDFKSEDCEFV